VPSRVPQLRTSPPCQSGLWRCHVSHGTRLCLSERRALALPRVPQLRTSPPCRGGLQRYHVAPASPPREESSDVVTYPTALSGLWNIGIKKGASCHRHVAVFACVQRMIACYQGACKACGHAATIWFNSATQTQLITPGHGYSGDMTR
jgi:hypothetical protein